MEKTTKKDMFELIAAMATEKGETAIVDFCEKEIAALDKRAAKAKERAAAKKAEADTLMGYVEDALTEDFLTIADIAAAVTEVDPEATVSKVTYRLNKLVEAEVAVKELVTIPATETSKTRKVQAYKRKAD